MLNFSFWDIVLIMIISLIVFGPNKLPDVARSMGKGVAEFRRMANQATEAYKNETRQLKEDLTEEFTGNLTGSDQKTEKKETAKDSGDKKI